MIRGLVQGVGFRPFIYRLAVRHGLRGLVENRSDGVTVFIMGTMKDACRLMGDILKYSPPASQIKSLKVRPKEGEECESFTIAASRDLNDRVTEVSPDIAVCPECLNDIINDPSRLDYPFVNCTNCGPRFTIIRGLPYDRDNTTMDSFMMCSKCRSEYDEILDRRFHAQPVACNNCGPHYTLDLEGKKISGISKILKKVSARLSSGKSIAIKGTGGYHLLCDALNNKAVNDLRKRKQRDSKPFAVMFRDLEAVKEYCYTDRSVEKELTSWRRPVVILEQKRPLAPAVSCGLNTIGAILPSVPFHYMLFKAIDTPAVILTSGNRAEEPVIIDDSEAEKLLLPVTGALISYNRQIHNRADDSVIRFMDHSPCIIRRSRGFVPRPVDIICDAEGIIAAGAEQKNTFCIGKGRQAIMSQYIGDLKNKPAWDFYNESIERFTGLFRFRPRCVVSDMHPDYLSGKFASDLAMKNNLMSFTAQHHHAHIASCMAEFGIEEKVIGIAMDGTGYGNDGNTWGSEFMIADLLSFERMNHFDYFMMPGGDRVVEEPWRMALSCLCKYLGDDFDYTELPSFRSIDLHKLMTVKEMMATRVNSPLTCGAGRIFDAVSSLCGLCSAPGFDSEAPMRLEASLKGESDMCYSYSVDKTISFKGMFLEIIEDIRHGEVTWVPVRFHNTIAAIILDVSRNLRSATSLNKVILSGGVFQNKYLLERSAGLLRKDGFDVFTNHLVPVNDGGISLGQLIIAAKKREQCV